MIVPLRRDNRVSKQERIRGLQPWFKAGIIRFSEDIPCRIDLLNEILRFPKYSHDDILDTLADQMQNRDSGLNYDVVPDLPREGIPSGSAPWLRDRFLGFEKGTGEAEWLQNIGQENKTFVNPNYHDTGL